MLSLKKKIMKGIVWGQTYGKGWVHMGKKMPLAAESSVWCWRAGYLLLASSRFPIFTVLYNKDNKLQNYFKTISLVWYLTNKLFI